MTVGRACGVMLVLIGCLGTPIFAQDAAVSRNAAAKAANVVGSAWTGDERILASAISIRAARLEQVSGFRFDPGWTPKVSLEWSLGEAGSASDAIYKPETQTVYFPIHVWSELAARHRPASGCLNADLAATDEEVSELLDHELGHELMDQVSRRSGLGPWFTEQRFQASTDAEKLGLDILSEGTAKFFQRLDSPRDDSGLSEQAFPASHEQQALYTYRMIAFDGGYWLVRDVLSRYGERGLIWLMAHPFVAADDMQAAAMAYRARALQELSHSKKAGQIIEDPPRTE